MKQIKGNACHKHFLNWYNNYLTIELYAEHHGWTVQMARRVIALGRVIHNSEPVDAS